MEKNVQTKGHVIQPGESMIRVVDLKKDFGDLHVLKGLNEEIVKGEVVSIIARRWGWCSSSSTFSRT